MSGSFAIGELEGAAAGEVVALWREAGLLRPWNDPHADIAAALACPGATLLGTRAADGALAAAIMAGFDGHRGWLYYLAVAEAHRGRGLGTRMVAAAEAWLAGQGAPKAQLMVRGDNAAVRGFYARLGYEVSDVVVLGRRLDGR